MTTIEQVLSELDHNNDNMDMKEDILRQWAWDIVDECTKEIEKLVHASYKGLDEIKSKL